MSSTTPTTEPWTTKRLLAWMTEAFTKKDLDAPRLSAEILLGHVLKCERLKLYMESERATLSAELDQLRALVARALKHEPVQYLTGEAYFFGLALSVDKRVLIPRPCTELIVEQVLTLGTPALRAGSSASSSASSSAPTTEVAEAPPLVGDELRAKNKAAAASAGTGLRIADLCTGSGAIAIALAKRLPGAAIIATDISPDAINVARANAQRHNVEARIDLRQGDLLSAIASELSLDIITANPPYIPDSEWDGGQVDPNVKLHEPALALRAGPDGLQFVRPLIQHAHKHLKQGGTLLIELASATASEAKQIAEATKHYRDVVIVNDHEGLPRVLSTKRV